MAKFGGWEHLPVVDDHGRTQDAIAPVIISASRSTDIPAFYSDWFMHRLERGYAVWVNPWNGRGQVVSFARARVCAFWSKDPRPFIPHLPRLDELGYGYYFLYTLNDYRAEGLEPFLPGLSERERTFREIAARIGAGRMVWRFDPLVLSDSLGVDDLLSRVEDIGSRLHAYTRRLVISFVDIAKYPKVRRTLDQEGFTGVREFSDHEINRFCSGLCEINADWGLSISACGEPRDLTEYGIFPGQCISGDLMREEFGEDHALMQFLGTPTAGGMTGKAGQPFRHLKDPGQRGACGCIASKDIGQYSTCLHFCRYCYANSSHRAVERNVKRYCEAVDRGTFPESIAGFQQGI